MVLNLNEYQSTPSDPPPRQILIIDDDPKEGLRLRDLLIAHGHLIDIIRDVPTAVQYVFPPTLFRSQLIRAKKCISVNDGRGFRAVVERMPLMVILDQFLPESVEHGSGTSLQASRELLGLVSDIWDLFLTKTTFEPLGWNLWVLMYTAQAKRHMSEGIHPKVYDKTWFAYAQKPQPLSDRSPEQTRQEALDFVALINGMTRMKKTRDRSAKIPAVFSGDTGSALLKACTRAFADVKPIWLVGRKVDGLDNVIPTLLGFNPQKEPKEVDEAELLDVLRAMFDGKEVEACVYQLRGPISTPTRLAYFASQIETRLIVIGSSGPAPELEGVFNVISIQPLNRWPAGDLKLMFTARYQSTPNDGVIEWLKGQAFNFEHFDKLAFLPGHPINTELIREICPELDRPVAHVRLDLKAPSATVTWDGRRSELPLSTAPGLCALAILMAKHRAPPERHTLTSLELLKSLAEVEGKKAAQVRTRFQRSGEYRKNHISKGPGNALKVLEGIFGRRVATGELYDKKLEDLRIEWILDANVILED